MSTKPPPRILLIDDLRSFLDGRPAEVARTSEAGVEMLQRYGDQRLDDLWLDHDLGDEDTIWPVVEVLERTAFEQRPLDIGVIYVPPPTPPVPPKSSRYCSTGVTTSVQQLVRHMSATWTLSTEQARLPSSSAASVMTAKHSAAAHSAAYVVVLCSQASATAWGGRNWTVLATPIPVDAIISGLPVNEAHWWRRNLHASARPIPPSTDEETLRELRHRIADFDEIVRSVLLPPASAGGAAVAGRPGLQEARDANMTAARLFSPDWRDLEPVPLSGEPSAEVADFVAELRPDENDLIQDDIIPFEGWEQHRSQGGWVEFQSEGRRLLVKNINFKPAETQTGADLVYWRSEPDAFVIVQYKVLDRDRNGLIHRINGNDRLIGQLEAMLACTRPDGVPPAKVADFRLAGTSAFVKFAHPMTKLHTDHQLIDGHYLPAELVQLMYAEPDQGRDGGKMLRFPPERSIDPETFSRLVRDCWIGTSGKASVALHRFLPGLRAMPPAHLVIAYDERRR